MSGDGPEDPTSTLDAEALNFHEIYLSWRRAGFGRWSALWLVACMVKGVPLPEWFADKLRDAEPEAEDK